MHINEFVRGAAPCYVYQEEQIRERCAALSDALAGFDLLYSVKANPAPAVLEVIADCGLGADAASAAEVGLAEAAGIGPEKIYYSAPAKSSADIEAALGRCVLVADSLNEIRLIQQAASARGTKVQIGIRINPDFSATGVQAVASKFGIDIDQTEEIAQVLAESPDVEAVGIHIHLQSQVLNAEILGSYYKNCLESARKLAEIPGLEIRFINMGSGVGVAYDPDRDRQLSMEKLKEAAAEVLTENWDTLKASLLVESGRYLTCEAGTFYTRVTDIKVSQGKKYVLVDCGMNGFLRPAIAVMLTKVPGVLEIPPFEPLFTEEKEVQFSLLPKEGEPEDLGHTVGRNGDWRMDAEEESEAWAPEKEEIVTVAGPLCTKLDVLGEDVLLPKVEIGDIIAVSNAGSYAYTLSPQGFAGARMPGQYILRSDGEVEEA